MMAKRCYVLPCLFCFAATFVSASTLYEVVDIGILPGSLRSEARAINDRGQVVGHCSFGLTQAFLWENGNLTALAGLGGKADTGYAADINNNGDIVGGSYPTSTSSLTAYLYNDGATTSLGTLSGKWSSARAINNNGEVVGASEFAHSTYKHAFLHTNGQMNLIAEADQLGYISDAMAINDNGAIAGSFRHSSGSLPYQAFLYQDGAATPLFGPDGEMLTYANDINNAGQIVGSADRGAFLWEDGQARYLGDSATAAHAINEAGHVAGAYMFENEAHAALFVGDVMFDLNDLLVPSDRGQLTLSIAYDINNAGQIVGTAMKPDGQYTAFLLTPVPEPATLVLVSLGVLLLWKR